MAHLDRQGIAGGRLNEALPFRRVWRFAVKCKPVRVKKTRQNENLKLGSDAVRTDRL
jgi:hypothetical protein